MRFHISFHLYSFFFQYREQRESTSDSSLFFFSPVESQLSLSGHECEFFASYTISFQRQRPREREKV